MTPAEKAAALAAALAAFRKREKATAKALLSAEAATLRATQAAALEVHQQTAARVLEDDAGEARVGAHVRTATPLMVAAVAAALSAGARGARAKARAHAGAPAAPAPLLEDVDTFAQLTASSIASGWAARAASTVRLEGGTPRAAMRAAREGLETSVARAAATETALAFNHELAREYSGGGAYREAPEPAPEPVLEPWVVWSAVLDGRTCDTCAGLDGTAVRAGALFPYGAPPLHPFCRCVPVYLTVARGVSARELKATLARAA